MLHKCVTMGMFSTPDLSFCLLGNNTYSNQILNIFYIILIWNFRMWTLRGNLRARLLKGQIPHALSTAEHIYGRDAAGAQTPEAVFGCPHNLNPLCRPWHRSTALEDVAPWSLLWTEGLGFLLPCSVLLVRAALSGSCTMENASTDLGAEPWNCCGRMRGGYKNIAIQAMKGG